MREASPAVVTAFRHLPNATITYALPILYDASGAPVDIHHLATIPAYRGRRADIPAAFSLPLWRMPLPARLTPRDNNSSPNAYNPAERWTDLIPT